MPKRFLLGANYWSRAGGPRMWERFDEAVVCEELRALKAAGLDCLRMFAFVPSMMPQPPAVDDARLALMARFAALAEEAGLALFPTPLVGHMSGENYGFAERATNGERSLYRDPELRAWQTALVRAVVGAMREQPSVAGFILSNEMPLWAGAVGLASGAPAADVVDWARAMTAAVRDADGTRPVGTGDGMMSGWPT
ncbi:MAG TPA: beta-mannosidase, partial [Polyangia bacterium]